MTKRNTNSTTEQSRNTPPLRFSEFKDEWEMKKLGEEVKENGYGPRFNGEDYSISGNVKTIRGTDISIDGEIKYEQVPLALLEKSFIKNHILEDGDLVMITTADCGLTGVFRKQDIDFIPSAYAVKIKLKDSSNPYYFKYVFQTEIAKNQVNRFVRKATVANLPGSDILNFDFFIPLKNEQTKIASFLTALDEKIQALKKKHRLLEQYKKGVMQKLFCLNHDLHDLHDEHDYEKENQEKKSGQSSKSQKSRFRQLRFKDENGKDFPEWEENKLGELGNFFSGGTPLTTKRKYFNGNIPFIRSGEIYSETTEQFISEEGLANSSAKMVEIGDLIYALYGATSGEVAISKIKGAINQAILCIRTSLDNSFLLYYLTFSKEIILKTYLQGGQGNLSAEIIKSLMVPVPHLSEQLKIANFITAICRKIEILDVEINATEKWKQGLLQKMFC